MGLKMSRKRELMRLWINMYTIPMMPEAMTTPLKHKKKYAAIKLMIFMQAAKVLEEGCSTF